MSCAGHTAQQRRIVRDLVRNVVVCREQSPGLGEPLRDRVVDGRSRVAGQVLREARNPKPRLSPHLAGIRRHCAIHELEQRRLAGAIAADQADPLTSLDREARALQQGGLAKGDRDAIEAEQRQCGWPEG